MPPTPPKPALIWTHEHAFDRLQTIARIRGHWHDVMGTQAGESLVMRWHWRGLNDALLLHEYSTDRQQTLEICDTRQAFALALYKAALAATRAAYPGFEAHHYTDGTRQGERCLVRDSDLYPLSWSFMRFHLYAQQQPEVSVTESMLSENTYRRSKMRTVHSHGLNNPDSRVRVEIGQTSRCHGLRPCALMTQGREGEVRAAVMFDIANGQITRYDLCIPQILGAVRTSVFPV